MTSLQAKQSSPLIPISVITGFLGSGKTTLLNELIKHPAMDNVAVLVNEFGEIGLDHFLVEKVTEDIVLLQSGCICCQIKDDLANTLLDLLDKCKNDKTGTEMFNRILIETTGVADPVPIVQVLISDPILTPRFRLDGIITVVDSVFGQNQLNNHDEPVKQVALADRLILTKADLVSQAISPTKTVPLIDRLKIINPTAPITTVFKGDIHPDELFNSTALNDRNTERQHSVLHWLNKVQQNTNQSAAEETHSHHRDGIASISLSLDEPLDWTDFSEWLDSLIFSRAENILRIKGILNVAKNPKPVVIQGVQNMFYPPTTLPDWPTEDHRSHLVFITYNFDPKIIETSLRQHLSSCSQFERSDRVTADDI